ncbi:LTA3 [Scenedesmus sp. PABB004]|nr:LTA3 [Scenedesmus sp. PABB004]
MSAPGRALPVLARLLARRAVASAWAEACGARPGAQRLTPASWYVGGSGARRFSSLPPHTELAMPALSPTMTQGNVRAAHRGGGRGGGGALRSSLRSPTRRPAAPRRAAQIAKWYVKVGDEIAAGTVLADIETDKATLAFENQEDGFIAAIVAPDGAKDVPVGQTVAIIVEDAADVAAFAGYAAGSKAAAAAPTAAAPAAAPAAPSSGGGGGGAFPDHVALAMPALSPTMERGNIVAWHVKEGDEVSAGTVLADIETDKATLVFENQDEGVIARILAPAGSKDVPVGAVVAVIVEDAAQIPAFATYTAGAGSGSSSGSSSSSGGGASSGSKGSSAGGAASAPAARAPANFRLGPAARKALAEAGLSAADVTPSGPNGIVTKADVAAAVAAGVRPGGGGGGAGAAAGAAAAPAAAKPSPAAAAPARPAAPAAAAPPPPPAPPGSRYTDVPASQVRQIIAKRLLESKLTAPSLYVSVDVALGALTALRARLAEGGTKLSVNDFVLRAAALALRDVPAANVRWDDAAGAAVPAGGVDVCVAVAIDGGLVTPVVRGADGKGLAALSAEGAILAVGGAQARVSRAPGGGLAAESVMTATLSADHRAIDGDVAAALLGAFKRHLENPLSMVL